MITKVRCNDDRLYFNEIYINQRLNILVGGNGVGKTAFLEGILNRSYILRTNTDIVMKGCLNSDSFKIENKTIYMSQRQYIMSSIVNFLSDMKEEAEKLVKEKKFLVILLDEIDNGLSVDSINLIMHLVHDMLENHKNIQFFISTNNYHFTYVKQDVINMYTGDYQTITSYEDYFELIASNMKDVASRSRYNFLNETKWFVNC